MKYIIIGRDESNGNEYVRAEAPATAEEAVELCERLNKQGFNEHTSYRIETIQALSKLDLNNLYAKLGGTGVNPLQQYKDTDSLHTVDNAVNVDSDISRPARNHDFTVMELFPFSNGYITHSCEECGSLVNLPYQVRHVDWHNKLLP